MLLNILLFTVLVICIITDLKSRKIYNKVIFPSLLLAFLLNGILEGWSGFSGSLLGFITGLGILLIPYLMGGMGAGDVKLLALVGAVKGASFVFATAILMAVIGAAIGLGIILFRKGFFQRLKALVFAICGMRYGMKLTDTIDNESLKKTFPYGVAIAGGAFTAILLNGSTFI
ncbi:prepilin peptidase [Evansella sp. LMS18]|jgi:prepilin peptidase CpaA|uniref:A24 family peptidase n=1 Tax=Evansella sp. LMS18 TaxID=2924033 RepID=UPI0020D09D47|nr:prepilin peptidase [Evansella sp. LMS18]UTR12327.1 prepilin peptidase [Evansella sp. LMS18]